MFEEIYKELESVKPLTAKEIEEIRAAIYAESKELRDLIEQNRQMEMVLNVFRKEINTCLD